MYRKIEIHNTEYLEKYLLISNNTPLYVGIIVKDIMHFIKYEYPIDIITNKINDKHNIQLTDKDVIEIKKNIDIFLVKKGTSKLYKVIKIFNPSKISMPKLLLGIFSERFFYIYFLFFFITNSFIFFKTSSINQNTTTNENVIISIVFFFVLFLHELGHSLSAKKFNVDVQEIGFGFYYFFPVFYVDLNESWKLKKEKRIIINLSGIYIQLIIGMILGIFISLLNENKLLILIFHINLNVIILNFNPFLKFDGYWIISDFFQDNNLLKTSNNLLKGKLNKSTKFKNGIILYTTLRILFIIYLLFNVIKQIFFIITKTTEQTKLSITENIFVLILILYVSRIVFTQSKKMKRLFNPIAESKKRHL